MTANPSLLQRLQKSLYIFFLHALYCFSVKPQQEIDDEAQIDLPVNAMYRGRLRTWMTKPMKNFRKADNLRHLGKPGLLSIHFKQCRIQIDRGMGSAKSRLFPFSQFEEEICEKRAKKGFTRSFL